MAADQRGDDLIETLVAGLAPVRRRSLAREAAVLAVLGIVEVALYLAIRGMRADMDMAMSEPAMWWKAGSLMLLLLVAGLAALRSFDPSRPPRAGLRRAGVVVAVAIALGWAIDAASHDSVAMLLRLDWREGLRCVFAVVVLSLPPLVALALLMRRSATSDLRGTALAIGLTAAAWGGLVFTFACPHDDPLYIALWYGIGIGLVALAARLILPPLLRW